MAKPLIECYHGRSSAGREIFMYFSDSVSAGQLQQKDELKELESAIYDLDNIVVEVGKSK